MSFDERSTVIYLVVNILVALIFGTQIYAETQAGAFGGPDGLMLWAQRVLWMIPYAIGLTILCVIVGQVLYAVITGEREFNTCSDERDKLIGIRGLRVTMFIFVGGWIAALFALASGHAALFALNVMVLAGWLSDLAGNLAKLILYRRGM